MRTKYRHSPQGTHGIVTEHGSDRVKALGHKMAHGYMSLPDDADIHAMIEAIETRDDVTAKRLLPMLKKRYGTEWNTIARLCLDAMGRWPGKKQK